MATDRQGEWVMKNRCMRAVRKVLIATLGLCAAGWSLASSTPCQGGTPDIQACMARQLGQANAQLQRYLAAAQARIDQDFGSKPQLQEAQAAWMRYRQLACRDAVALWGQGSRQTVAGAECMLRLTRQRTHTLWQVYLTNEDSSPALLPEPPSFRSDP